MDGGAQPVPAAAFALDGQRVLGGVFRREAGGLRLVERHAVELPIGSLGQGALGGPVADADSLASSVAELVGRFARRPSAASLVLPDAWARGLVAELGSLPERAESRADVLRFCLRKLVPFRSDELRVAASPIVAVAGQEDPIRALLLYASEPLCSALEACFEAAGVRIGQITGTSLAQLGALAHDGRLKGLTAIATVEPGSFTLLCARDGAPVAWRQKFLDAGAEAEDRAPALVAELRLTRTFLAERLGSPSLDAVLLAAPAAARAAWSAALAEGLGRQAAVLAAERLPLAAPLPTEADASLALLVGAACREVA